MGSPGSSSRARRLQRVRDDGIREAVMVLLRSQINLYVAALCGQKNYTGDEAEAVKRLATDAAEKHLNAALDRVEQVLTVAAVGVEQALAIAAVGSEIATIAEATREIARQF
jgi:soluble lytic murein transglycosylase-like protein